MDIPRAPRALERAEQAERRAAELSERRRRLMLGRPVTTDDVAVANAAVAIASQRARTAAHSAAQARQRATNHDGFPTHATHPATAAHPRLRPVDGGAAVPNQPGRTTPDLRSAGGGAPPRPRVSSSHATSGWITRPLTEREHEVAVPVCQGLRSRDIATRLFISQRTAEEHVQNILAKLGFTSRAQIAAWIARSGSDPHMTGS